MTSYIFSRGWALALLSVLLLPWWGSAAAADWRIAKPGWQYEFPRDHWSHSGFKTEWWYFTGQLQADDGRRFGYQITFFRQGIRTASSAPVESSLIVSNLSFGHAALTHLSTSKFEYDQILARGSFGDAGFGEASPSGGRVAWIKDWELTLDENGNYTARATVKGSQIALRFSQVKPWVIHGQNGISQKATGEGRASHYYSGTRLSTSGQLMIGGKPVSVTGESWFDHEWASNQLTAEQAGWDWFSLQMGDGTELMLYQLRLKDGGSDINSSGTFVAADGTTVHLQRDQYELIPTRFWKSPATGANYPIGWSIRVPKLRLDLDVSTPVSSQELNLSPASYWEGTVTVTGSRGGRPASGHGYMELTGYSGPLVGLTVPDKPENAKR